MGEVEEEDRSIAHYNSSQKILLVGEGDFSFSACLAKAFNSGENIVATSYDTKERLREKYYSSCESRLEMLKRLGCLILHEVDVHDMDIHPILMAKKFDRIVYNFPHAGHFCFHETDPYLIKKHKKLLEGFFKSASEMLSENGEVHVTHRDDNPYNRWKIEKQASKARLMLKEKVQFRMLDYPSYENKRGGDIRSNESFPLGCSFTFKFSLAKDSLLDMQENEFCEIVNGLSVETLATLRI